MEQDWFKRVDMPPGPELHTEPAPSIMELEPRVGVSSTSYCVRWIIAGRLFTSTFEVPFTVLNGERPLVELKRRMGQALSDLFKYVDLALPPRSGKVRGALPEHMLPAVDPTRGCEYLEDRRFGTCPVRIPLATVERWDHRGRPFGWCERCWLKLQLDDARLETSSGS